MMSQSIGAPHATAGFEAGQSWAITIRDAVRANQTMGRKDLHGVSFQMPPIPPWSFTWQLQQWHKYLFKAVDFALCNRAIEREGPSYGALLRGRNAARQSQSTGQQSRLAEIGWRGVARSLMLRKIMRIAYEQGLNGM